MNKLITVLIFLLFANANSQDLTVEYEYVDLIEYPESFFKGISEKEKQKIIESVIAPEKQTLYYKDGDYFYKNEARKPITITNSEKEVSYYEIHRKVSVISPLVFRFYKYKNQEAIHKLIERTPEDRLYLKMNPKFDMEYKSETQMIDDFESNLVEIKQKNGDIIKVWYTEEIPIQAGPLRYFNFPGLVLKVEEPTFVVYAVNISKQVDASKIERLDPELGIYEREAYLKKMEEIEERLRKDNAVEKVIQL